MDLLTLLALCLPPREAVQPYLKPLPLVLSQPAYTIQPGDAAVLLREDAPVLAELTWGPQP